MHDSASDGSPEQRRLDDFFAESDSSERARWALLRSLKLKPGTKSCRLQFLLEIIHGVARAANFIWSVRMLADRMQLPASSVRETIRYGRELGLIQQTTRHSQGGRQDTNALAIDWEGVHRLARAGAHRPVGGVGTRHPGVGARAEPHESQHPPGARQQGRVREPTPRGVGTRHPIVKSQKVPPPDRPVCAEVDDGGLGGDFGFGFGFGFDREERERLIKLLRTRGGIKLAEPLIDRIYPAMGHHEILAIVTAWQRLKRRIDWERPSGALHHKLSNARAGDDLAEGWPPAEARYPQPSTEREYLGQLRLWLEKKQGEATNVEN